MKWWWALVFISCYLVTLSASRIHFARKDEHGVWQWSAAFSSEGGDVKVCAYGFVFRFSFEAMLPLAFTQFQKSADEDQPELSDDESGETRLHESYWLLENDDVKWSEFRSIAVYMCAADEVTLWYQPIMYGVCVRQRDVYIMLEPASVTMYQLANNDSDVQRVLQFPVTYLTPEEKEMLWQEISRQRDWWVKYAEYLHSGELKYYHVTWFRRQLLEYLARQRKHMPPPITPRVQELAIVPYDDMQHEIAHFDEKNPFCESPVPSEGSNTESVFSEDANSDHSIRSLFDEHGE